MSIFDSNYKVNFLILYNNRTKERQLQNEKSLGSTGVIPKICHVCLGFIAGSS